MLQWNTHTKPYATVTMQVNYTTNAFAALTNLINFIEAKNTEGAGIRWLERYEKFIIRALTNASRKRLCQNDTFKKLDLRCIYFKDWVIAFSIHDKFILIEALLHRSRITD